MYVSGPRARLTVESASDRDAVVVRLAGEIDAGTVHLLGEELRRVWETPGLAVIVVDAARVEFCDSRGLSELITAMQRGQASDVPFLLAGVHGVLRRVLTITGLRNVFERHPTVAAALESVRGPAAAGGPADTGAAGGAGGRDGDADGLFEAAGDR
ncbi:STAS domain-containing protein [Microbispora sp. RL4-1S]|uniref:Anti-sigma factor antagonist n=1 Tax=Microbispora oryzae TaxID=2806554 RepID=A0A940WTZ6_9ACTN|nr:STAS domain-containing protein [Microbispora oryzae]MBP2707091.1 STAS domain-containing protein [Microbispora oryzae]